MESQDARPRHSAERDKVAIGFTKAVLALGFMGWMLALTSAPIMAVVVSASVGVWALGASGTKPKNQI